MVHGKQSVLPTGRPTQVSVLPYLFFGPDKMFKRFRKLRDWKALIALERVENYTKD